MDHVAIMQSQWKLLPKILTGEKTIESRWYATRRDPWNQVQIGDHIYFKNSGAPVSVRATVERVLQYSNLDPQSTKELLSTYRTQLGLSENQESEFYRHIENKQYAIFIFITEVEQIKPFEISKAGYGQMSAWLTVNDIKQLVIKD